MLNSIKILMILLVFILLMPFGATMSYAWGHGSGGGGHHGHGGGGYHGFGGRGYGGWGGYYGYGNLGLGYNYWPYNYYYPGYYDAGVYVSSPIVETPEIVEQPSTTIVTTTPTYQATTITPVQITPSGTDDDFSINIPNFAGGYTSVLLKKSGKGFVGPQGEYYPEFPRVSLLKVMYGK